MNRNRAVLLSMLFLMIVQFVFTGAYYSRLPATIPTHWNFRGEPDAFGPRSTIWIMPFLSIPLGAMFPAIAWWVAKSDKERFSLFFMGASTLLFFAVLQVMILSSCMGHRLDMTRWMGGAISTLFALLGVGIRDLPRNHIAGIRLPWTLASDEAWAVAHHRSARIMVIGGVAGLLLSLANLGLAGIAVSVVSILWTIVDSYIATRPGRLA